MQTIWSRAIRTKSSCRCPSCLSPQPAISRHTTTVPFRRRIGFGSAFTACYSGILATAAVADAVGKDQTRERLEKAIISVQEELRLTKADQAQRLKALNYSDEDLEVLALSAQQQPYRPSIAAEDFEANNVLSQKDNLAHHDGSRVKMAIATAQYESFDHSKLVSAILRRQERMIHVQSVRKPSDAEDTFYVRAESFPQSPEVLPLIDSRPTESSQNSAYASSTSSFVQQEQTRLAEIGSATSQASSTGLGRSSKDLWLDTPPASQTRRSLAVKNRLKREAAVAQLIYRLLLYTLEYKPSNGPVKLRVAEDETLILDTDHIDEVKAKVLGLHERLNIINSLRDHRGWLQSLDPLPFPSFSATGRKHLYPGYETHCVHVLNNQLATSMSECHGLSSLVAEVCHLLITSEAEPNVHTFNIMLIRFCHLHYFNAVEIIYQGLLRCGIRPNEVTAAAMLNFYTYTNDLPAFNAFVKRMDVTDGNGLLVVDHRDLDLVQSADERLVAAYRNRNVGSGLISCTATPVLFEKMMRNQEIFNALILGWFQLGSPELAVREYGAMHRNGGILTSQTLIAIISHCCQTKDWSLGEEVWQRATSHTHRLGNMAYYWMLQLCELCDKSKDFQRILSRGVEEGLLRPSLHISKFSLTPIKLAQLHDRSIKLTRLEQNVGVLGSDPTHYPTHAECDSDNLFNKVTRRLIFLSTAKISERGGHASVDLLESSTRRALTVSEKKSCIAEYVRPQTLPLVRRRRSPTSIDLGKRSNKTPSSTESSSSREKITKRAVESPLATGDQSGKAASATGFSGLASSQINGQPPVELSNRTQLTLPTTPSPQLDGSLPIVVESHSRVHSMESIGLKSVSPFDKRASIRQRLVITTIDYRRDLNLSKHVILQSQTPEEVFLRPP